MTSGRKRKPTALRVIEGNRGHRPLPENEPKFTIPDAAPTPPGVLDAYGREEWDRVAPEAYAAGTYSVVDAMALAGYCMAVSRWRTAEEAIQLQAKVDDKIKHRGLVQLTKEGNAIQNVLVGIANAARKDMIRAAAEFGFTPASRANLEGSKRGDEDPAEAKFFGR